MQIRPGQQPTGCYIMPRVFMRQFQVTSSGQDQHKIPMRLQINLSEKKAVPKLIKYIRDQIKKVV